MKKYTTKTQSNSRKEKKAFYEEPFFLIIFMCALTIMAFLPSLNNGFMVSWDDNMFVTENVTIKQLDFHSIGSMFTTPVVDAYVPLTLLSFAVEYHFFGLNPFPYHISNLILHLACIVLVFHFFRLLKLDIKYAALGAILFGIHPMHVESVAWITERKDLLFGLFYIASLVTYIHYIRSRGRGLKFFILSMLFFILALFSRVKAVSLPISLLLIDYYTERPLRINLLVQKIPYFVLSLVFGITGIILLKDTGVLHDIEIARFSERMFFGFYAITIYIVKFFAPFPLSAVYPYPQILAQSWPLVYYLTPFFLFLLGFIVFRTVRTTRAFVFGALFFLINIIFLIQIVAVGNTYLSDRYSFIPYIGFCFMTAWSMEKIVQTKKGLTHSMTAALSFIIVVFSLLTYNRCEIWKNDETLWTDAIEKYPHDNAAAYYNRGFNYWHLGQAEKALADYSQAIEIDPTWALVCNGRGVVYENLKQWDNAIADYSRSIDLDPNTALPYNNRGIIYCKLGQWEKAISDFSRAIGIDPNCVLAYSNRGIAYRNLEQWEKSLADCSRAIEIDPKCALAYNGRGNVYGKLGQWERAITDYTLAIEIEPASALPYNNRGRAYGNLGQWEKAIADYSSVIQIEPNSALAYNNRSLAFAKLGQMEKAKADYAKAMELHPPPKK